MVWLAKVLKIEKSNIWSLSGHFHQEEGKTLLNIVKYYLHVLFLVCRLTRSKLLGEQQLHIAPWSPALHSPMVPGRAAPNSVPDIGPAAAGCTSAIYTHGGGEMINFTLNNSLTFRHTAAHTHWRPCLFCQGGNFVHPC